MAEPQGKVLIVAKDPKINITVPLGPNAPNLPGAGLGGWGNTAVVEGEALSTWEGQTQVAQDLDVFLDGWGMHPQSVQREFDTLLKLALIRPNASPPSPPPFRVFGPVHFPGRYWVLPEAGIELSTDEEEVGRLPNGDLYRQRLTLHLQAYSHDTPEKAAAKRRRRENFKDVGEAVPLTVVTGPGETFLGIATRVLDDWQRWKELAEKNPKLPQAPYITLPAGVTLIV